MRTVTFNRHQRFALGAEVSLGTYRTDGYALRLYLRVFFWSASVVI